MRLFYDVLACHSVEFGDLFWVTHHPVDIPIRKIVMTFNSFCLMHPLINTINFLLKLVTTFKSFIDQIFEKTDCLVDLPLPHKSSRGAQISINLIWFNSNRRFSFLYSQLVVTEFSQGMRPKIVTMVIVWVLLYLFVYILDTLFETLLLNCELHP